MSALTYKDAGVDIEKADEFVERIKLLLKKTDRPGVIGKIGGFGGLFKPQFEKIKKPVLVSATDGVGTKLILADLLNQYDTVGIDLVAMCVNDIVVLGAEPLFFLDYIACGKLQDDILLNVMKGIVKGCQEANCALIGGETAELPGMYAKDKLDLAGFCVGIVSEEKIIGGHSCQIGDQVIGLASSGLHSNGFSLVRKIFNKDELKGKLGRELLRPTKIYVQSVLQAQKKVQLKAMAHITGGGFYNNIPRVLPKSLAVKIKKDSWPINPIFRKIQRRGDLSNKEMFKTFNMGVGMVLVVSPKSVQQTLMLFEKAGQRGWVIGEIVKGSRDVKFQGIK